VTNFSGKIFSDDMFEHLTTAEENWEKWMDCCVFLCGVLSGDVLDGAILIADHLLWFRWKQEWKVLYSSFHLSWTWILSDHML